jgi:hypothetical protein
VNIQTIDQTKGYEISPDLVAIRMRRNIDQAAGIFAVLQAADQRSS